MEAVMLDDAQSEAVVMAADMAGIDIDEDLRRDYSGRGMYGDECVGIVCGDREYGTFLTELADDDPELARELADSVKTDSMATRTIYYWPQYRLAE